MRDKYLARMLLPLRIIRVLMIYVVILNLVLPYLSSGMGLTSLGKWLFLFGQIMVCFLSVYTCIGTQGGLGNLFSITTEPFPLSYWILIRVFQFVGMTFTYGISSLSYWFYILLVLDILFLSFVYYRYSKFELTEEDGSIARENRQGF